MQRFGRLDPCLVAELEGLIAKLAAGGSTQSFSPRERELVTRLRESREVVLGQLHAALRQCRGANDRGRAKLEALARGIERICDTSN